MQEHHAEAAVTLAADFALELVPVRGEALEHGDLVFERVQWGGVSDVKWKKWRVIRTDGAWATVVAADGPNRGNPHKKIRFSDLRVERHQKDPAPMTKTVNKVTSIAPPAAVPKRVEPAAAGDSQYEAWVEMGRGLVSDVTGEQRALIEQKAKILRDLDAIDGNHRKAIEALELELEMARKAHKEDRALAEARMDSITGKLERINERKKALEQMLGDKS